MAGYNLIEALDHISPSSLHYDDWLKVGQALNYEGYTVDIWRSWTAQDPRPDHAHRLEKVDYKWGTFGKNIGEPVTGGTIVVMAKENGWHGKWYDDEGKAHKALSWDSVIGGKSVQVDEPAMVDPSMIGDDAEEIVPMFPPGHESEELTLLLGAMFDPDEIIGYVTECEFNEDKQKWEPCRRGVYSRTMGDVRSSIERSGIEDGLSCTLNKEAGAYLRINPLDGKGVGNVNVASFRHALVESDTMSKGKFASIVKQLNLPIVALIDSGNKSLHAIVRVDAIDEKQYRERVELLYERCSKNGIEVDNANKNPSRMTRMAGVMRGENRQFLVSLSQGAGDWEEWNEWYEEATDELPDCVALDSMLGDNLPSLKPALIDGVLRVGHKMLVSGPSKAGKSFALINLCIALAESLTWFGLQCRQAKVMYVNLELDDASCINRFNDMYHALGIPPTNASNIEIWNLRGKSEPMMQLLPKLVRRAKKHEVEVIVLDPIYKVMVGDENSAGDMAKFANLFDALCEQAGVSAIYCHHHSKGSQAGKRSIDRASGSGVFGRDPDAIMDIVELDVDSSFKWKHIQDAVCRECEETMRAEGLLKDWMELPETTRNIERNAVMTACEWLEGAKAAELNARCEGIKAGQDALTAWRISTTLREFPSLPPINVWFDWPLHVADPGLTECKEVGADGDGYGAGKSKSKSRGSRADEARDAKLTKAQEVYDERNKVMIAAVKECEKLGIPATRNNVLELCDDLPDGTTVTSASLKSWTRANKSWSKVKVDMDSYDEKNSAKAVLVIVE